VKVATEEDVTLPGRVETAIIGAGHAGLTMSWYLGQAGRDHVLLDRQSRSGGSWRERWDGFRLVTPNWTASFPGNPYSGPDPDGFMSRDEIDARVAGYAEEIRAPVEHDTDVLRLAARDGGGFELETSRGTLTADEVVVATGSFHIPRIPAIASELPGRLTQLHSHEYRNERALPPGAVLIVGSGQSGCQIAEELAEAGRRVYLSVGSAGRAPRRYRGRDIFRWLAMLAAHGAEYGVPFPTVDKLPDIRLRSAANPQLSGHQGGHDVSLRQLARDGMRLLHRIERVDGECLHLRPGLSATLALVDGFFDQRFRPLIDRMIDEAGIAAPPDDRRADTFEPPEVTTLDLREAEISTVIWATGYRLDYRWLAMPILDEYGFPRQRRGVSDVPGLYFLGLLWQHTQASATLFGPRLDAPHLVAEMGLPVPPDVIDARVA
jgi:putative flavoprotein involved in K+ transport